MLRPSCLALVYLLASVVTFAHVASAEWSGPALVSAVWGCATRLDNGTAGCVAGDVIALQGAGFVPAASITVDVGGYNCSHVVVLSSTLVAVTLPPVSSSGSYAVRVYNGEWSLAYSFVSYGQTNTSTSVTAITAVTGCAAQRGNVSIDCVAGARLYVWGRDMPANFVLYVAGYGCSAAIFHNASCVSGLLPLVSAEQLGRPLDVTVYDRAAGVYSNRAWLRQQAAIGPYIRDVTGCGTLGSRDCAAGDLISITGDNFTAGSLDVYVGGYSCTSVTRVSAALLTCTLPSVPRLGSTYQLYVRNNGYQSNALFLGRYALRRHTHATRCSVTSASPFFADPPFPCAWCGSTGYASTAAMHRANDGLLANVTKQSTSDVPAETAVTLTGFRFNKQSEKLGRTELALFLTVAVVMGLLLLCQVLYCLHHFAGVRFPRLARLTGGRLFAAQPSAAAGPEAYEIGMGLMEHDCYQHTCVLVAVQPGQPSSSL